MADDWVSVGQAPAASDDWEAVKPAAQAKPPASERFSMGKLAAGAVKTFAGDLVQPAMEAWTALKSDFEKSSLPEKVPDSMWGRAKQEFDKLIAVGKLPVDAFNLAVSPLTGVIRAGVARPISAGIKAGLGVASETAGNAAPTVDQTMLALSGARPSSPGSGISGNAMRTVRPIDGVEGRAAAIVAKRMSQDAASGGPSATDALDQIAAARAEGKPLSLVDLGGANVKSLGGYVARQPGESQNMMRQVLEGRVQDSGQRLSSDIDRGFGSGSANQAGKTLAEMRKGAAHPFYEEAFQPGSVAPLETQFEKTFSESTAERAAAQKELSAAEARATQAAAQKSRAGDDVYANNSALDAERQSRESLESARARVATADKTIEAARSALKNAQSARESGIRGGVWSPRLQEFLDDPIVQSGLKKGLRIQKLEALADGKQFNPKDFAITGTDEAGDPVVSKVPNMRALDAAKRGLDDIVEESRDKTSGRLVLNDYTRAVNKVRAAFVQELDRLTGGADGPYAKARAAWSGPSQSLDALNWGKSVLRMPPDKISERFSVLSPSDKEFARLGAAQALRELIAKGGPAATARKILGKSGEEGWVRQQIRPLFSKDADFDRFINSVENEAKMISSRNEVLSGSQTAARLAEDTSPDARAVLSGGAMLRDAVSGNMLGALRNAISLRRDLGLRRNPELNSEIAKILINPLISREGETGRRFLNAFAGPATRQYLSGGASFAGGNALSTLARGQFPPLPGQQVNIPGVQPSPNALTAVQPNQ